MGPEAFPETEKFYREIEKSQKKKFKEACRNSGRISKNQIGKEKEKMSWNI